ncbi:glycosyltransferase [Pseudomonas stutzeri]|nr:glycosyltransferase [Stutzerimonas stutzeri]MCQ4253828.1 glycosyltransferase [Stutzerimonas stutzeri]
MHLSYRARAAFQAGDYVLARELYERAIAAQPELSKTYRVFLDLIRRRQNIVHCGAAERETEDASTGTAASPCHASRAESTRPVTLNVLYQKVASELVKEPQLNLDSTPLVSVLMTAHNIADYIEEAVTSVLRQSWPNLELIIVDDASTDATWTVLQRLRRSVGNLRCRRLNTNLGTYFAKNHALQLATGKFIFFQDGDDICHPERIRLGMQQLMQPGVVCVRGAYSRVLFPSGHVLPVNGMISRLGLITLGLRREVFERIGFFNCTSKASDEEFFLRLKAWIAVEGGKIHALDLPLYYSCLRKGSLAADMLSDAPQQNFGVTQLPSPSRAAYVEAFTQRHRELSVGAFRSFFRFPVLRDLIPVAPDMTYLANPAQPVVASLCSIPERADQLRQTLASLAPQIDALHLYLDRYEAVPDFVKDCHPRMKVYLSQDYPGLRDNGKFLAFATQAEACYYFTADDDILYPPDYVASMLRRIEHYGRQAVVGVHGVLVPDEAQGYFSGFRKVLMFTRELERDALVSNLGTGTVAFHSSLLRGLDIAHFREAGMADIYLSLFCKQRNIPMVAIARPEGWLQELPSPNTSLYQEFRQADERQSLLIRTYRPWGYTAIRQALAGVRQRVDDAQVHQRLEALVPALHQCLR